jgi:hypothetical protein
VRDVPPTCSLLQPDTSAGMPSRIDKRAVDYRLYAVTDPKCNKAAGRSMTEAVAAAVAGGATVVQVREKEGTVSDFLQVVKDVIQVGDAGSKEDRGMEEGMQE